jgi:hypothetical protein
MPVAPSAERGLRTCLEAEREVVSASRFCFAGLGIVLLVDLQGLLVYNIERLQ